MLLKLFLAFTLVPLIEIAVLIRVGGIIGAGPTLALVVGTGLAGAWLARREGARSWRAVQTELAAGRLPATGLIDAFLILVAGVVLVTPGIFTDLAGLLLLVPGVRRPLAHRVRRRLAGGARIVPLSGAGPFGGAPGTGAHESGTRTRDEEPSAGTERRGRVIEV